MSGTVAARGSSRHRRATRRRGGAAADVELARARRSTAGWCAVAGGPHSGCVRWGLARAPPRASSQAAGGPPPAERRRRKGMDACARVARGRPRRLWVGVSTSVDFYDDNSLHVSIVLGFSYGRSMWTHPSPTNDITPPPIAATTRPGRPAPGLRRAVTSLHPARPPHPGPGAAVPSRGDPVAGARAGV
jgi:hypothetical protein